MVFLFLATSCSRNTTTQTQKRNKKEVETVGSKQPKRHKYGGWYCPDNLKGFPAVDIEEWHNVAVVEDRLPTKEETQNGTSLIFIDIEKYPNAKVLDMELPKLARYYNSSSKKNELVVIIQAISVLKDSIVGFRYLNGGNGSAHLKEVELLSSSEIEDLSPSHFVSVKMNIKASQDNIWDVLTNPKYRPMLEPQVNSLLMDWESSQKVNLKSPSESVVTSEFADKLYGNHYIQIDYMLGEKPQVEKILLVAQKEEESTKLQLVCGPYIKNFSKKESELRNWAQKVKELSEENSKP